MKCRLYKVLRPIAVFLLKAIYRIKIENKDNIPDGPFIFVGNHKHNYDFISLISGTKRTVHFLAKKELIDKRGWLFGRLGIIPVDRSTKNKEAVNEAINEMFSPIDNPRYLLILEKKGNDQWQRFGRDLRWQQRSRRRL